MQSGIVDGAMLRVGGCFLFSFSGAPDKLLVGMKFHPLHVSYCAFEPLVDQS